MILKRLHNEEGGAVALLMLAAVIIVSMLSWIIYDAGIATRNKVNVQASADAAAFSQASVKARSMNMMAYTNIAKRSIWAVQSLYPAYLSSTYRWIRRTIEKNAGECKEDLTSVGDEGKDKEKTNCTTYLRAKQERIRWIGETCASGRCEDVGADQSDVRQWGLFWHLHGGEKTRLERDVNKYLKLDEEQDNPIVDTGTFDPSKIGATIEGSDWLASQTPYVSLVHRYYAQDIRGLDNYQRYIYGATPWWAWVEQLIRAVRNGATMSSSWPRPLGYWPLGIDGIVAELLGRSSQVWGGSGGGHSSLNDSLPVRPSGVGTMTETIAELVRGSKGEITSYFMACLKGIATLNLSGCRPDNISIDPFALEHIVNGMIFTMKSTGILSMFDGFENNGFCRTGSSPAPFCVHLDALFGDDFERGLRYTQNSYTNVMGDDLFDPNGGQAVAAEPWVMRTSESEAEFRRRTSNIVMTYRSALETFEGDRTKYSLGRDYRGQSFDGLKARMRFWSHEGSVADLARQEMTYSASGHWGMTRGEIFYTDADHPPDLWHPSWSARLRPVSLGDEFAAEELSLNHVYRDIVSGFVLGSLLGVSGLRDVRQAFVDLAYMDKATIAVNADTEGGITK